MSVADAQETWKVIDPDSDDVVSSHPTREAAIQAAWRYARKTCEPFARKELFLSNDGEGASIGIERDSFALVRKA
jgi:hypothetical protein